MPPSGTGQGAESLKPGDLLHERYQVGDPLGQGEVAVVHRAYDLRLRRPVAVKVLKAQPAHDPRLTQLFHEDGRKLSGVENDHVRRVWDAQWDPIWGPFLVLQLVEGLSLDEALPGPFPLSAVQRLAGQVGAGLHAVHETGLVHRDVTPANILLSSTEGDFHAWITDLGIARAAGHAERDDGLRASAYTSPEALRGHRLDRRADVYSLACVLVECLTGGRLTEQTPLTLVTQVGAGHGELGPGVERVLRQALSEDPDMRYATAPELADALAEAGAPPPESQPQPQPEPHPEPEPRPLPAPAPQPLPETQTQPEPDPQPQTQPRPAPVPQPRSRRRQGVWLAGAALVAAAGLTAALTPTGGDAPPPGKDATPGQQAAPLSAADAALAARLGPTIGTCIHLDQQPAGIVAALTCARAPEGVQLLQVKQWDTTERMQQEFQQITLGSVGKKPTVRTVEAPCRGFVGGAGTEKRTGNRSTWEKGPIACYLNESRFAVLLWQIDNQQLQLLAVGPDADSPAVFAWWQQHRDEVLAR